MEEIEKSADDEQLFELVGQILISKGKKELSSALKEKMEILEFRLKTATKAVDESAKKLQEIQKSLEKKG